MAVASSMNTRSVQTSGAARSVGIDAPVPVQHAVRAVTPIAPGLRNGWSAEPAPRVEAPQTGPLVDQLGRLHKDLRISLTDHCNLRCTYCMPAEGVAWSPPETMLTTAELLRLVELAVPMGIEEVRLTGGEPLLRRDVVEVVAGIASTVGATGPPEVSMTTNGLRLERLAVALKDAGLARLNISLDTLKPDRFLALTRRDRLGETLAGIDAAAEVGFGTIKLNAVLMRGVNDDEAVDLSLWALERGHEMRFIEQMPLDAGHTWSRSTMVSAEETLRELRSAFNLTPIPGRGAAPAERYLVDGGPGVIGVIASVSKPFCGACDRLRLTSDGQLRSCLFSAGEFDLRGPLRAGADVETMEGLIRSCLWLKQPGHAVNQPGFLQPPRPMSAIGG